MADDEQEGDLLGGALGMILRAALEQAGSLRELFEREAQSTKEWLDRTLLDRRRRELLINLGERALEAHAAGRIDDAAIPGVGVLCQEIESLSANLVAKAPLEEQASFQPWTPKPSAGNQTSQPPVSFRGDTVLDEDLDEYLEEYIRPDEDKD